VGRTLLSDALDVGSAFGLGLGLNFAFGFASASGFAFGFAFGLGLDSADAFRLKTRPRQILVNTPRSNFFDQVVDSAEHIFKQTMSVFPLQNDIIDI
jgi:hypothetical protein